MQPIQVATLALWFCFGTAFAQLQLRPFLDLPGETSDPSISWNGRTLAFDWWPPDMGGWGIYTRPMRGGEPRLFANSADNIAVSPRWSPDGRWIAFLRSPTPHAASLFIKPATGGEERLLGAICNDEVAWTADSRALITPINGDTDSLDECRLTVLSIEPGRPSWQLAHRGTSPALSPNGETLAFVRNREIRLISLTRGGRAAGSERTLVREPLNIMHLVWVPKSNEIAYLLSEDRSVIRRIEARQGAKPRNAGSIAGEFNLLSLSPSGGQALAEIEVHDDSYWRIELQAPDPHFEKLRRLPWNVSNLRLSPDGQKVLYTVSALGGSEFYTSNLDGSGPRSLFSIPYQSVERPVWSPDGRQIAFTAEPGHSQVEPSHLFIASTNNWSPRRLLRQFDEVYRVSWSRDGQALYFAARTKDEWPVWKLSLADNKLTQITRGSGDQAEQADDSFIYLKRRPFILLRVPLAGGREEPVVSGALEFTVGRNELYFVRQDAKPPTREGLNLYQLNLAKLTSQLVANIGFGLQSLQLSPDARFIYAERHDPRRRDIMLVQGWR
jgi:Tol biopolymer transport system component